ncbi:hypothetical protein PPL_01036 [Heterostelium album PN500]|uniref:Uncharacterized protein n=1 Tax=Heterostelium pallidum (strain ATCC 26659 / Pp 5 / PN500) TaxID=670386 RepID=D3AXX8_HETP5|nr:hypothetical protein PPL_01036 [Heterostelium album PN500]EFA85805.1 hypothetical protein PPL_01036 [Heterostelium album PN500]|eukprot:XP_020437911.1 hypothetical protein PPL_01036 [Heterostelium album PN500]
MLDNLPNEIARIKSFISKLPVMFHTNTNENLRETSNFLAIRQLEQKELKINIDNNSKEILICAIKVNFSMVCSFVALVPEVHIILIDLSTTLFCLISGIVCVLYMLLYTDSCLIKFYYLKINQLCNIGNDDGAVVLVIIKINPLPHPIEIIQ